MKFDSTAAPTGKRIAGTLHTPRDSHPAPSRNESLPTKKAAEGEVAGQPKSSGQKDDQEVGWDRKSTSFFSKLHANIHPSARG